MRRYGREIETVLNQSQIDRASYYLASRRPKELPNLTYDSVEHLLKSLELRLAQKSDDPQLVRYGQKKSSRRRLSMRQTARKALNSLRSGASAYA